MTTNINSSSSSQMKHIAFSKPRVDDDSRVEALDALTMMLFEEEENKEEEEMMMMSEAVDIGGVGCVEFNVDSREVFRTFAKDEREK